MTVHLFLDTDQDTDRDLERIAALMLFEETPTVTVSYVSGKTYMFSAKNILKMIRLTRPSHEYSLIKVVKKLTNLKDLDPDLLVVYVSKSTHLSERVMSLLYKFNDFRLVFSKGYRVFNHLPEISEKTVTDLLQGAVSERSVLLRQIMTEEVDITLTRLRYLKDMWRGYDLVESVVRVAKKKIITRRFCNRREVAVTALKKIFEQSDTQIGERLKKAIDKRAENNVHYLTDLLDLYRYVPEEEFKQYLEKGRTEDIVHSEDVFMSSFTLSSWYDELETHGCIGVTAFCCTGFMGKIGRTQFTHFEPRWELFGAEDFLYSVSEKLESSTNRDLNRVSVVSDTAVKPINAVLPLFINKIHWGSAQKYIYPLLGLMMSHNPMAYTPGHKKAYFVALCRHVATCTSFKRNFVLLALWRTCFEIAEEEGYLFGFKKLISKIDSFQYDGQSKILLGEALVVDDLNCQKLYSMLCCEAVYNQLKEREFTDGFQKIPDGEFISLLDELWEIGSKTQERNEIDMCFSFRYSLLQTFGNFRSMATALDERESVLPEKMMERILTARNSLRVAISVPDAVKRRTVFRAVAHIDVPKNTTTAQLCSMRHDVLLSKGRKT